MNLELHNPEECDKCGGECPNCGEGTLHELAEYSATEIYFHECMTCGSVFERKNL